MALTDLNTFTARGRLLCPPKQCFQPFRGAARQPWRSAGLTICSHSSTGARKADIECNSAFADVSPNDFSRRGLLATVPLFLLAASAAPTHAESLAPYEDAIDKFRLSIPEDWVSAQGSSGGNRAFGGAPGTRRALAWYPQAGTDTNVTVIITNVGADYTALGSFGDAQQFGENLVASLDRSFLLRSGFNRPKSVQRARLLDAKTKSGMYMLEYTVQKPEEDEPRHFLSAVSLGNNGRYNRLYTLTAQTKEADFVGTKGTLQEVLGSFRPPAPVI
ncbi:g4094 [Coccomyxa viridis]|uniref:G4094 protein n=1 Tax=Coccomyxa viridis TaxID=1274662 RepID=A0ABP1FTE7_9CHLO